MTKDKTMTNDTPERIWAFAPDIFDEMSVWQDQPSLNGDAVEYIRADHEALEAALAEKLARADDFDTLITEARAEAGRAMQRFPQPNYVISKVAEEAGEVVKAAIHCAEDRESAREVRTEMKQLIAMLYRLWVEGDQVHGLPPLIPDTPAAQETTS